MIDNITPEDFVKLRESGELWQLLDVRETWEIEIAAIAGAVCIPMSAVPERRGELDDRQGVAVICHSGGRSAKVATYLAATGFARVANIAGGIDRWSHTVDARIPRY